MDAYVTLMGVSSYFKVMYGDRLLFKSDAVKGAWPRATFNVPESVNRVDVVILESEIGRDDVLGKVAVDLLDQPSETSGETNFEPKFYMLDDSDRSKGYFCTGRNVPIPIGALLNTWRKSLFY